MRFGIPTLEGNQILEEWLKQHSQSNDETFLKLLKENPRFTSFLTKINVEPIFPSINSTPFFPINALKNISELAVKKHLQKWINGRRTLGNIAEKINKDPLIVTKLYSDWSQKNWLIFETNFSTANESLPTILSVDDSPIVQTTIKRILVNRYNLLLASNGLEALNLLNKNQVSLLILDLTMPDVDGLQMCQTIRNIPKFSELPIIMLTARDGLFDKFKGKMAGANHYLTKPFDSEMLLSVVRKFVAF